MRARSRYVRSAPRKARLVMDHIRGKEVEQARAILTHAPRAVAEDILKLLNSAIANAESAYELGPDELRIVQGLRRRGPHDQALPAAGARARHADQEAHQPHDHRTYDHSEREVAAMGQKVHPEALRVGYIHDWKSTWFNEKEFSDYLMEDIGIRDHIENKLAHAGLSTITIKKNKNEVEVNIHTARPGIVIGKSGLGGGRPAQGAPPHDRQGRQGQHPRDQAPRARREARGAVDRRAAPEPRGLPARDEARADQRHALGRQGREDPGVRPPRRRRDGAHRGLLGRPRAAAHAARRHRLRLLRGAHDLRPHRREGLDQQGRDHAQGLRAGPDRARGAAGRRAGRRRSRSGRRARPRRRRWRARPGWRRARPGGGGRGGRGGRGGGPGGRPAGRRL